MQSTKKSPFGINQSLKVSFQPSLSEAGSFRYCRDFSTVLSHLG